MTAPIDELIERLGTGDINERGLALGELINRGDEAAPALRGALENPDAGVRALAAEGLGRIDDPSSADSLFAALDDSDEKVRSQAATALARLGDPRAIDALIRTLNDNHDLLRAHLSLSAYTLRGLGQRALPAVAPLLKSGHEPTRTKAFWIVRAIVSDMPGESGDWSALWESLGRYDPEGPEEQRNQAADLWASWIKTHAGGAQPS